MSIVINQHIGLLGHYPYVTGSKSFCMRKAEELERTQGLKSWTVAPLDPEKGVWGLFI